jgi:hypothetical protein
MDGHKRSEAYPDSVAIGFQLTAGCGTNTRASGSWCFRGCTVMRRERRLRFGSRPRQSVRRNATDQGVYPRLHGVEGTCPGFRLLKYVADH